MSIVTKPLSVRWNPEQPIDDVTQMGQPVTPESVIDEIRSLRKQLGKSLILLGHHYQRDEVVRFADRHGDSLELSRFAAKEKDAETIIFLGVHFMAETADMLTDPDVAVVLPDMRAGCTMADMAQIEDVESAWEEMSALIDGDDVVPVTYINSTAAVKNFVGRHGGTICTSSNARKIIEWALSKKSKVFFFPDQHLGRNTSFELGIPLEKMILWDPEEKMGGNSRDSIKNARVLLWKGHCSVHQHFQPSHADIWRERIPGIQVIVHPECSYEVVQNADFSGSTAKIIDTVMKSPSGSKWAVGTENHLVERLGNMAKKEGKEVYSLAPYACLCSTMFRISPESLLESVRALVKGEYRWRVQVDDDTRKGALMALDKMFEITGK